MYFITINVQYVRYSTGRKIKYFIILSFIILPIFVQFSLMPECQIVRHLNMLLPKWKKIADACGLWNQSGTKISGPSPVPEYSGAGLDYGCRNADASVICLDVGMHKNGITWCITFPIADGHAEMLANVVITIGISEYFLKTRHKKNAVNYAPVVIRVK